ncbi:MAG: hypothetical protein AAGI28_12835 [Pseudomonadota bacterium]
MRRWVVICALLIGSCGEEPRKAPVDYDAMNEAAKGPAYPVSPQPIASGELAKFGLSGAICLVPDENHRENLFASSKKTGILRLNFETLKLLARPTDSPIAFEVSDQYGGLDYTVELAVDRASETPAGPQALFYNGEMVIRDEQARIVFEHRGRIECASS